MTNKEILDELLVADEVGRKELLKQVKGCEMVTLYGDDIQRWLMVLVSVIRLNK